MSIASNLQKIKSKIPDAIILVAVSKTKPISEIFEAYNAGQRIFGENKIQELVEKYQQMPKDIQWHMIGHLQRNKVKYIASFIDLIHGVDSLKTLKEINKQAKKNKRIINCLLQVKIAKEETKFGLNEKELMAIFNSIEFQELKNVNVLGLMGMASFTNDTKQIKQEFEFLKALFDKFKATYLNMSVLSMGMTGDYAIAIKQGSTMIRIGSAIFGNRN